MDNSGGFPFISIVMPVRNEERYIQNAVMSLLRNDYPADKLELIISEGRSDDATRSIVERMMIDDPRIRLVDNPEQVVTTGMNRGIEVARGQYIVRVDGHAEYAEDYLKACVECLERTGAGVVGGYIETLPGGRTRVAKAIALATSCRFGVGDSRFRIGGNTEEQVDTVPFGAFRREVFDKVGVYHPHLSRSEDIELALRIRGAGYGIIISPSIRLRYFNRSTFAGLCKFAYANGMGIAYTLLAVGRGIRPRHLAPAVFTLFFTVMIILGVAFGGVAAVVAGAGLAAYLGAGLLQSILLAVRARDLLMIPHIWATFILLHWIYGYGTLRGLITIPFRRKEYLSGERMGRAGR